MRRVGRDDVMCDVTRSRDLHRRQLPVVVTSEPTQRNLRLISGNDRVELSKSPVRVQLMNRRQFPVSARRKSLTVVDAEEQEAE